MAGGWGQSWGGAWGGSAPSTTIYAAGWVKESLTHLVDGSRTSFPITGNCAEDTLIVFWNGVLQCCSVSYAGGGWGAGWGTSAWGGSSAVKHVTLPCAPEPGDQVWARYRVPFVA